MTHAGEIAALTTAALWSVTSVLFTLAGRHVPAFAINTIRTIAATLLLGCTLWIATGAVWPVAAPAPRLADLALSGLVGLALGDTLLFQSYTWIGPRLASLMMALAPPLSALGALILLHERLGVLGWAGMALTLGGIVWVVAERVPTPGFHPSHRALGLLAALGGAVCQAGGAILAKRGMQVLDPLAATLVRMTAAAVALTLAAACFRPGAPRLRAAFRSPRFVALIGAASLLGPYLGVWFSLVSLKLTEIGVALTLMALTPILVIPLSARVFGERPSFRTIAGTVLAVAGVVVLLRRG
jgi:drug/metabolite transporter (DMT)-like permease